MSTGKSIVERIREAMKDSTFCYAKENGEGFVNKDECTCGNEKCCQEFKDKERFHDRCKELGLNYGDFVNRNDIIQKIKPEFADSKWWKDNVVE